MSVEKSGTQRGRGREVWVGSTSPFPKLDLGAGSPAPTSTVLEAWARGQFQGRLLWGQNHHLWALHPAILWDPPIGLQRLVQENMPFRGPDQARQALVEGREMVGLPWVAQGGGGSWEGVGVVPEPQLLESVSCLCFLGFRRERQRQRQRGSQRLP